MGVINVTPDSFSDGGMFFSAKLAIAHARKLAEEGVDIIDIGGESTRPGAAPVPEDEELSRVMPVLEQLSDLCVSVDTRRPAVMKAALAAGASMINDVDALTAPGALEAVAESDCAVCLMHKKGEPATMQQDPHYDDVVGEVKAFLQQRVDAAHGGGHRRRAHRRRPGLRVRQDDANTTSSCSGTFPGFPSFPSSPACRANRCWRSSPAAPSTSALPAA